MLLRVSSIHEQSIGGRVTYTDRFDQNYEPTREEILEYADFLGINLETEEHLLWIAKESLKAPLPKEWKPWYSSSNKRDE